MIIIDLSVRKRENCLQKIKLNYKFWKLKKKTITLNYFFITIFSFGGALVDWDSIASKDPESLLLRSPLAGTRRVARTISIVEDTSFSLSGSRGAAGGLVASRATPLLATASFSAIPCC